MWIRQKVLFIAALGIVFSFSLIWVQHRPAAEETFMISKPPVSTFASTVAARGLVEAADDNVVVGISIPGVVKETYVDVWQSVKKGDALLLIDDDQIRAQIAVQKRAVYEKKLLFEKTCAQLTRLEAIEDSRAISVEELDNKRHDVGIALVNLRLAIAQIKELKTTLSKHIVYAPRDGQILVFNPRVGEFSNNLDTSPQIMIGNPGFQVRVDVDEVNASRVRAGAAAVGYPKALSKPCLELRFVRIEPYVVPKRNLSGSSDERTDTRVLQVIYSLQPNETFQIYVGQQIDVYIDADPIKG